MEISHVDNEGVKTLPIVLLWSPQTAEMCASVCAIVNEKAVQQRSD